MEQSLNSSLRFSGRFRRMLWLCVGHEPLQLRAMAGERMAKTDGAGLRGHCFGTDRELVVL